MKNSKFKPRLLIYCFSFALIVSIIIFNAAAHDSYSKVKSECRENLQSLNQALLQDEDGVLNTDEVKAYEECVEEVRTELDASGSQQWENNRHEDMFMLECYMNLMNYYDNEENDEKAEYFEDKIDEITGTD